MMWTYAIHLRNTGTTMRGTNRFSTCLYDNSPLTHGSLNYSSVELVWWYVFVVCFFCMPVDFVCHLCAVVQTSYLLIFLL